MSSGEFLGNSHIKARDDGGLVNADYERVAIRVGAGEDFHDAWTQIGKKHRNAEQRKYRNGLARHALFKKRIQMIVDEKAAAEADASAGDEWAEALFMVKQFYREVFALGDAPRIQKAVEMRMEIARQRSTARGPAPAPASMGIDDAPAAVADEEARPVGRPVVKDPQAERSMEDMRAALAARGVKAPKPMVSTQ